MLLSRHHNAGRNHDTKTTDRSFGNVSDFNNFGMTVTNQNLIQGEIMRILNSGNACYHSAHNILSSCLLSKNLKKNICKNIILPVVLWPSGQSSWLQNGDILCFLWGTNWMYICYVEESRPPLRSSGQSSWLQIQRSEFDSRRYQIFWEVVGLERGRGPPSFVSTIEELLGRKSSGSGLEMREYGRRDPSRWTRDTPSNPQKLALTSPTSGGRSVGIVRSRTQATEFSFSFLYGSVWFQTRYLILRERNIERIFQNGVLR
jgi:hypothetical protein